MLLAAAVSWGQSEARPTSAPQTADWIAGRLSEAFRARGGTGDALRDHRYHFVFLFCSSRAEVNSGYTELVKSTITAFIDLRTDANQQSGQYDQFSFFPYQLDLYTGQRALQSVPMTRDAIPAFESVFPNQMIPVRSDGSAMPSQRGQDNVGARSAVMRLLGQPDRDKPLIVIQFTDISTNEDPADRRNDQRIRGRSGQFDGLADGFVAYEVAGQPFSAQQSKGKRITVHAWMYGPGGFSQIAKVGGSRPARTTTGMADLSWLWWVLGIGIVGALVAAAVHWSRKHAPPPVAKRSKTLSVTVDPAPTVTLREGEFAVVVGKGGVQTTQGGPLIEVPKAVAQEFLHLVNESGQLRLKVRLGELVSSLAEVPDVLEVGTPYEFAHKYSGKTILLKIRVERVEPT